MKSHLTSIYARVSSEQQKEEETINSQLDILISYAQQNGLEVPPEWIFKDDGYSGKNLDRPGLDRLRELAQDNVLGTILIYSPDRLSRSFVNQLLLEEEFKQHGIQVHYLKNAPKPPETKEDEANYKLLSNFQGVFAEYERALILDRTRRGRLFKAKLGDKNVLPNAPYGYNKDRKNYYIVNPEQAAIVKEIFRLYTQEGYTLRKVSKYLEEKGISSPGSYLKWSNTTVRCILANSAYIGTAYYGKTEKREEASGRIIRYPKLGKVVKAKNPIRKRPHEQWIPVPVPAIVAESDFEAAQLLLKKNKEFASRNTKQPTILQGLLVCGQCGLSYYKRSSTKKGKKWTSYVCRSHLTKNIKWCGNRSIKQSQLDEIVWNEIVTLLEQPHLIEEEIQRRIEEAPKETDRQRREKELESEIRKIKAAQDKLLDLVQNTEDMEIQEIKPRLQRCKAQEKELRNELKSIQAMSIMEEKYANLHITVEEFQRRMQESVKTLDIRKKQEILRAVIEEIVIKGDEITIKHSIPLSGDRSCRLCCVGVELHFATTVARF